MKNKDKSRRSFIKKLAVAGVLAPLTSNFYNKALAKKNREISSFPISLFSKHLEWLDYEQTAETVEQIGFDGIDFTVRPNGHVLPEQVKKDLPRALKAAEKYGLKVKMITTAIKSADDKYSADILKTAADHGIQYYRMGYLSYDEPIGINGSLDQHKKELSKLAELNESLNIHGAYQNHSGTNFGAAVWDLYLILKDLNPDWLGVQYDIRHAVVEGGYSWPIALQLLSPWIKCLAIKDFVWDNQENKPQIKNVPLGEGIVDFNQFFALLKKENIQGPISLHYEYPLLSKSEEFLENEKKIAKVIPVFENDLAALKEYLKG